VRLATVAGPPSAGKTSATVRALECLREEGVRAGVVKFDCLATGDGELYARRGIPVRVGLSGNLCPDHFFVANVEDALAWAAGEGLDLLVTESAGLCNRCAPHLKEVLAVCVVDNLSGVDTPRKIGPMLRLADAVVITKGDVVSQAEREVFAHHVRRAARAAAILHVNGLTGQGALALARLLARAPPVEGLRDRLLRFTMPAALCSYCLGQRRIGEDHQIGNLRKMRFEAP
jgi:Ni2+-binding GTPase involved in maturation of urease and hydrogenase